MPLPYSRRQVNLLGTRLASRAEISDADYRMLEEIIACHEDALGRATPRLDGMAAGVGVGPLAISSRPKTTGTIMDKLRRQSWLRLAGMQDLAGIRVVAGCSFAEQDLLAAEVERSFPGDPRPPRTRDRRNDPSHGYRAVHVIVSFEDLNIEVQVRTITQHLWADLMERLADRLGRGIRYGEDPVVPAGANPAPARLIVGMMVSFSETWNTDETAFPADSALRLQELTEAMWEGFSEAIARAGIDWPR
jgi:Region found in RelA / SpoT proteins